MYVTTPTRFELILATKTGLRKIERFGPRTAYQTIPPIACFQLVIYADFMRQRCNGARIYIETCALDSMFELASVHLSGAGQNNAGIARIN